MAEYEQRAGAFMSHRWGLSIGVVALVHATLIYAIHQGMLQVPQALVPPQLISDVALIEAAPVSQAPAPVVPPQKHKAVERVEPRALPKTKPVQPPQILHTRSDQGAETVTPVVPSPPAPAVNTTATSVPVTPSSVGNAQGEPKAAQPVVELPSSSAAYLNNPKPAYPSVSKRMGEQGKVVLRVYIEADGSPGDVRLLKSSGFDRLDQTAVDTVKRWRFVPGKRGGVAEAMWFNVPISFVLE